MPLTAEKNLTDRRTGISIKDFTFVYCMSFGPCVRASVCHAHLTYSPYIVAVMTTRQNDISIFRNDQSKQQKLADNSLFRINKIEESGV